jgi:hypothetical protein
VDGVGKVGETYPVVMLDSFGNKGIDEQGELLLCWGHFERLFVI